MWIKKNLIGGMEFNLRQGGDTLFIAYDNEPWHSTMTMNNDKISRLYKISLREQKPI